MAGAQTNGPASDQSMAELTRQLADQTTSLVRHEVELAKAELAEKGKRVGMGAGTFGGAGVVALYVVGALVAAAISGLAMAVDAWLAGLIVGLVLAAVAGVLALIGKGKVQQATPPMPEQAITSAQEDVETVKARAHAGRR
jgi:MFS family permease